jgi:riboflavin transporter FmnP
MSRLYTKRKSIFIAGTAILGATVAVLDWLSKIFSLKVPFPLLIPLKFDVIGIPAAMAYFLFGPLSGVIACLVAFLSISFRDPTGFKGFMKCIAELATIIGAFLILRVRSPPVLHKRKKIFAGISSVTLRVVVMAVANILLLPVFISSFYTTERVIALLPLFCIFNAIQGTVSITGGFLVYEAIMLRLPSLKATRNETKKII